MKKRLIFTLLFEDGFFVLSRNFRTQRIGDLNWLRNNYDFSRVSFFIDELVVLNVSRKENSIDAFSEVLRQVSEGCFAPIVAGGGIRTEGDADRLFRSGADKISMNSALLSNSRLIGKIASHWGRQATVASLDVRRVDNSFDFYTNHGQRKHPLDAVRLLIENDEVGEIYLNSIDRDGTGQGMSLELVDFFSEINSRRIPLILAGGAGHSNHLISGLQHPDVSGVATANLLNFVGNGLSDARNQILQSEIDLAKWTVPAETSYLSRDAR